MRAWCLAAAASALLTGCDAGGGNPSGGPAGELTDVTAEGLDQAVQARKGSVVVVDFWATWCGPCVERFPHLVALHKKYADHGLVCVSASIDKAEKRDDVRQFLARHGATFPNYLLTDTRDPDARRVLADRFGFGPSVPYRTL